MFLFVLFIYLFNFSMYKSENKGLISEDRRNKPTLPLTIPHSLFKSSTKDLSQSIFEIMIRTLGSLFIESE